jgi:hypothetical protein
MPPPGSNVPGGGTPEIPYKVLIITGCMCIEGKILTGPVMPPGTSC